MSKMIRLISENETFSYKIPGTESIIFYKRINNKQARVLSQKYTQRGELDNDAFGNELLSNYITGWKNIADEKDKAIDFKPELIFSLPNPILVDLINKINGDNYEDELVVAEKK